MPTYTPRLNLKKPALTDPVDVGDELGLNWDKIDVEFDLSTGHDHLSKGAPVRKLISGLGANRPASGAPGQIYYATDEDKLYIWSGSAWRPLRIFDDAAEADLVLVSDPTTTGKVRWGSLSGPKFFAWANMG